MGTFVKLIDMHIYRNDINHLQVIDIAVYKAARNVAVSSLATSMDVAACTDSPSISRYPSRRSAGTGMFSTTPIVE